MRITDRYASAVHSSSLKVSRERDKAANSHVEDTDALTAFAWADRDLSRGMDANGNSVKTSLLAVALQRLFAGDSRAVPFIVDTMADMVWRRAREPSMRVKVNRQQAHDMACACLAWSRNGTCKACGGHGKTLIPGSRSFSGHDCQVCAGTGKIPFAKEFRMEHRELAAWLVDQVEREAGRAGPAAMRRLADNLNFLGAS